MKFSTIFASISIVTIAASKPILTPRSDPLGLDVTPRDLTDLYQDIQDRDLLTYAEELASSINLTSIIDSIDFEGIAGWANNLLTEDDNVKYLDYILEFIGTTNLVPAAISYIVSNNSTRSIAGDAVVGLLGVAGQFDITPVFVALKNSGLLYTLIADLIENPNTLPFVIQVVKDTLAGTSFGNIVNGIGGSGSTTIQVSGAVGNTAALTLATGSLSNLGSLSSLGSSLSSFATAAISNINTNGGSANGGAGGVTFGIPQGSVDVSNINTASIAALISAAAAQESGNTQLTLNAAGTTTTRAQAQSTQVAPATTQAPAATTAAAANGNGGVTSYDFRTIQGPAFQSLPPSQFGIGATTINYSALAQVTAALGGGGSKKRDDFVEEVLQAMKQKRQETDEVAIALQNMKRDNIEDLLTTIFSSITRSGLLNETIQYLVTDDQFEGAVVQILTGVFANIGSTLSGALNTDWSKLVPLVNSLLNSGLLTDIITRAFNDQDLKNALYRDLQQIFKRDLELTELQLRDLKFIARDQFANSSVSISTVTQSTIHNATNSSSVVTVNGAIPNTNKFAPMALAAIGLSALIL
ncbi:uncharacterized protein KGF55_005616 [Candida pseudojiufengensis]|uniref:uncharacterized protein n=1 Tax=Candida pseudojiufengensis TaxID=497109 RepID=UPI002224C885|nr:uncharacterized protein KGF55_005616 [Candida pseudojiufengensis]KAI5958962.1 hypothetical protein KGF55_005616 [Candida pseudojiufengensis]